MVGHPSNMSYNVLSIIFPVEIVYKTMGV